MEIWVVRKSQRKIKNRQQQDRAVPFVEIYCEKLYRKKLFSFSFNITFVYRYNKGNWSNETDKLYAPLIRKRSIVEFCKRGFDFSKPGWKPRFQKP